MGNEGESTTDESREELTSQTSSLGEPAVGEDIEALKEALAEQKSKAQEHLANWQRAEADLINYKKRSEQERGEIAKFANASLMLGLLPILDDFERALGSVPAKLAGFSWVGGVELIYRKLKAILEAQGLSEIKALGELFDPRYHEAVMNGEGDEGKVIEVVQRGYKLHDRVIRPTMVVVGKGREKKQREE
jgi:molecular chaperone GrpE